MGLVVWERFNSGHPTTGQQASDSLEYVITGVKSLPSSWSIIQVRRELIDALLYAAPSVLNIGGDNGGQQLQLDGVGLTEEVNADTWFGSARYILPEKREKQEPGYNAVRFNTSGGKQKITQSLLTTRRRSATGEAPDLKGAINVNDEGEVEGVEIELSLFEWSETWVFENDFITPEYAEVLKDLTGTVNNAPFRAHDTLEVKFLGAEGQRREDGKWELTYSFAGSDNVTDLIIGDITVSLKPGWDYLWVRYSKSTVGTGTDKVITSIPKHVYVEKVYEITDFSRLLIGIEP